MKNFNLFFLFSLLFFSVCVNSQDGHFQVVDWCFCKEIRFLDKSPVDCLSEAHEIRNGDKLYLWMNVVVNRNGVTYLKKYKRLPIYHAWGVGGVVRGKVLDVGIDPGEFKINSSLIGVELKLKNGSFDWRTYSERSAFFFDGEYFVSVLDANKKKVFSSDNTMSVFKPIINIKTRR